MRPTISLEIPAACEALVRPVLAFQEEMRALALAAPDGAVLDTYEAAVVRRGRALNTQILADAVARRIETAEKRGPRSGSARAAGPRRTAAGRPASSSPRSGS
ncbi:MAG TPA: hypothetical protein VH092_07695 [Urbifossiella sp.]|nr:hypothetical protein [Urbifossiella sp.]